jgi:hypothetical protein
MEALLVLLVIAATGCVQAGDLLEHRAALDAAAAAAAVAPAVPSASATATTTGGGAAGASSPALPALPRIVNSVRQASSTLPTAIPESLREQYTRCGAIRTADYLVDDSWGGKGSHFRFGEAAVLALVAEGTQALAALGHASHRLPPKHAEALAALAALRGRVDGARVLVLGSTDPKWEAVLVVLGAAQVTTVEHNR